MRSRAAAVVQWGVVWTLVGMGSSHQGWAIETSAPSRLDAGAEAGRFSRQDQPRRLLEAVPAVVEDQTPPAPEAALEPSARAFPVGTIQVEPSPLISPAQLRPLIEPFEGRVVTLDELQQLMTQLTRWLRSRGYVTSRAYLPPQEVTAGAVTIKILEGRVGQVRLDGPARMSPEALLSRMRTAAGAILDYQVLQRDLTRLNANADRRATAVLVPGEAPGTTDVLIRLTERWPVHAGYLLHNAGTAVSGRMRQGVRTGISSLTGRDDQLVVRAEWSERSDFLGLSTNYLLPLGEEGATLGVDVSYVDVTLGRHFRSKSVTGDASVISLTWAQPLWQAEAWELEWATGVDWKRIRSSELGTVQGKDDLRVLRLGPNLLEEDAGGRSILTSEVGLGFDGVLGGSHKKDPAASRSQTGGQFTRVHLAGGRLQRLGGGLQAILRGSWQATNDRLPPVETVRLGGVDTVRGYPEGEFLGDYGYTGTAELRLPLLDFGSAAAGTSSGGPSRGRVSLLPSEPKAPLTLVGFVDFGAAFLRKPLATEEAKKRLVGWGVGSRLSLSPNMTASVDVGFPIGDTSVEEDHPRLYYALSFGF